ncbi:MAG: HAD family hydrolase [Tissierellia bacterium]|nr:HAD family hydrolase [Tissierellia bacterium]
MYIFDVDGTILDTVNSIQYHANKTFKKYNLGSLEREDYERFLGNGAKYMIDKALDKLGEFNLEKREEILKIYNKSYDQNPSYLTKAYPKIKEVLKKLKEENTLVAFSNKPHSTLTKVIKDVFGEDLFDYVLGQSDRYKRKPSPEGIYIIKDRFRVNSDEILYFGDSEVDILCGKNAGVFTIACSWGFRDRKFLEKQNADLIIDDAKEILNIRRV